MQHTHLAFAHAGQKRPQQQADFVRSVRRRSDVMLSSDDNMSAGGSLAGPSTGSQDETRSRLSLAQSDHEHPSFAEVGGLGLGLCAGSFGGPGSQTWSLPFSGHTVDDFMHDYVLSSAAVIDEKDLRRVVLVHTLNQWFVFSSCLCVTDDIRTKMSRYSQPYIVLDRSSLPLLLTAFQYWTRVQLMVVASAHHVGISRTMTKKNIIDALKEHFCTAVCHHTRYIFQVLANERRGKSLVSPKRQTETSVPRATLISQPSLDAASGSHGIFSASNMEDGDDAFPEICSDEIREKIIHEFQTFMRRENREEHACAVCGVGYTTEDLQRVNGSDLQLHLLRNEDIDGDLCPSDYAFEKYDRAFLDPSALQNTQDIGDLDVCGSCARSLDRGIQPVEAIANYNYYAYDKLPPGIAKDFKDATLHELQLISACRVSRISYVYSAAQGGIPGAPQRYSRGNTAIIPQDVGQLCRLLPASPTDSEFAICVLFVGGKKAVNKLNMKELAPVLVSKSRVERLLRFLTEHNAFYRQEGIAFSPSNLEEICCGEDFNGDVGITKAVQITHLPSEQPAANAPNSGYSVDDRDKFTSEDDILMEVVGFPTSDSTSAQHSAAKASALSWCLKGGNFFAVQGGSGLLPDRDPRLLSLAFCWLDPYGIGGFNNPLRDAEGKMTMSRQLKLMMKRQNCPFDRDTIFPFVGWNILQKMEVTESVRFRVKEVQYQSLCNDIMESAPVLDGMSKKWAKNVHASASNNHEKKALKLLNRLKVLAKDIRGSNGHKMKMRNEIRALLKQKGCPALFVTLNPSDIDSRILHLLAGGNADDFDQLSYFQRARQVAENPAAAAKFFDLMIRAFLRIIVRYENDPPGLFGICNGYYGTVETQGRGTLHCHMLLWLKGNLNPKALRSRMESDNTFKNNMFRWIESIVKCELPGMMAALEHTRSSPVRRPKFSSDGDTRTTDGPLLPDPSSMSANDRALFETNFQETVKDLAARCNWHEHRDTCFKHLKPGQPRDDDHCRMRMTGDTRSITELDDETKSILLRRLHPWINNFNDVVIFLFRCNMDIKYIGSGQAAKALVFYITDYITKSSLPTHLGLQALIAAIKSNALKFADKSADKVSVCRSLLTKVVNAMMGRHEFSQPQVLNYLVGGGDSYSSDRFHCVDWGSINRWFLHEEQRNTVEEPDCLDIFDDVLDTIEQTIEHAMPNDDADGPVEACASAGAPEVQEMDNSLAANEMLRTTVMEEQPTVNNSSECTADHEQDVTLNFSGKDVTVSLFLLDYRFRSKSENFESLTVWEHLMYVHIVSMKEETERLKRSEGKRKSSAAERVPFSDNRHPLFHTHFSRLGTQPLVPVLLGPAIPRSDKSVEGRDAFCRVILILFKPWRSLRDLKTDDQSWTQSFENHSFPAGLQRIIDNIHIENECQDARDEYSAAQRRGECGPLLDQGPMHDEEDREPVELALLGDEALEHTPPPIIPFEEETDMEPGGLLEAFADDFSSLETVKALRTVGLATDSGVNNMATVNFPCFVGNELTAEMIMNHRQQMSALKEQKRPHCDYLNNPDDPSTADFVRKPQTSIEQLSEMTETMENIENKSVPQTIEDKLQLLQDVLTEQQIDSGSAQDCAVRLIAEHSIDCSPKQLLMYIGGVGGTGKSHVINTVVQYFRRCGLSSDLLMSAPTGNAAILINGYTI